MRLGGECTDGTDWRTALDVLRSEFVATLFGSWLFVTFRNLIIQHKPTKYTVFSINI